MAKSQWVINGKFLKAKPTGVQRVARELVRAIDGLLVCNPDVEANFEFVIAVPRGVVIPSELMRIPVIQIGVSTSQLWEQVTLPRFVGPRKLLNLCNLAPLLRTGVVMIHDAQVHITPSSYSKAFAAYYKTMQPLIAANAAKVLTVSSYSRDMLVKYRVASAEKIVVIPNGGDHILRVHASSTLETVLGLTRRRYALAFGSTQIHKNIGVLLKAFSRNDLSDIPLVLVGATARSEFEKAGYYVPRNVIFAGWMTDGGLRDITEKALCLLVPSTTEGFGLPPLEAMTLGCPVVCTSCGALPEVCGDAAEYADANDPNSWVDLIRALANDDKHFTERGAAGLRRAKHFSWESSAKKLLGILSSNGTS